jgi:uncharacterized protein (TIGR00297 family)
MAERALLGLIMAALITAMARRTGSLDESGQWAALGCGVAAAIGGWSWAIILVGYFAAASVISHVGGPEKAKATERSVPQIHARTFMQVAANGGLFCLLVMRARTNATGTLGLAALGALAAASADTWATEVGTMWGGRARSILTWRPIATGMSGGVTWLGTLAAVFGAAIVAGLAAWQHGLPPLGAVTLAVLGGGFAGCIADSILGATVQARRWCDHCKEWTERRVHPCSYRTVHAAGFRWISNNIVNAASTVVGAASAVAIARLMQ